MSMQTTVRRGSFLERLHPLLAPAVALTTWVAVVMSVIVVDVSQSGAGDLALPLQGAAFATVGAVIVVSRRGNRIGWLFVAVGLLSASGILADAYASEALGRDPHPPLTTLTAWYSEWFWIPMLFLSLSIGPLIFPTGRIPSERWRPFLRVMLGAMCIVTVLSMLDPVLDPSAGGSIPNPIGISPFGDVDEEGVFMALFIPLLFGGAAGGLVALLLRFRRSIGIERQQLKWFTYSAFVMITSFIALGLLDGLFGIRPGYVELLGMVILPVGTGIAILRYRLFDIDLVVNRTLVYLGLTVLLGLAYVAGVAVFRAVLPVGQGDLSVAVSTLAVAALFAPLRRRIQDFIDRHFYRRKYDAQRTIGAFTARLRDEVDLSSIMEELVGAAEDTVQPQTIAVWLRPSEAQP